MKRPAKDKPPAVHSGETLSVSEHALGSRIGHLRGKLKLPADTSDPWRKQIRKRNWRPAGEVKPPSARN